MEGEMGGEGRVCEWTEEDKTPRVGSHPMSKILKNTRIAELIWLAGAAAQMFATGGKHPRSATDSKFFPDDLLVYF